MGVEHVHGVGRHGGAVHGPADADGGRAGHGVAQHGGERALRVRRGAPVHAGGVGPEGALGGGSIPTLENSGSNVDLDTDAPLRRAAPFLRLDAEVSRTWSPRLAGRRTQVTPYLRVINALENRDGLFYRYLETDDDGDSTAPSAEPTDGVIGSPAIATLPLVPVLGVTWKF